jgi:hypothetical protein
MTTVTDADICQATAFLYGECDATKVHGVYKANADVLAEALARHREQAILEGMEIMREAALRSLQTAQYDPAPYTKGKQAITAIDPAAILAAHTRAKDERPHPLGLENKA